MRGYDYLQFLGHDSLFTNAELRFPLVEAMATPIGVLGGIRGTFFFNFGRADVNGREIPVYATDSAVVRAVETFAFNQDLQSVQEVFGPPIAVDGFRLVNGRASYGISLQTMAIGFPLHFDWAWRTLFNRNWEDILFAQSGGSEEFRKVRFSLWIGYDF